MYKRLFYYVIFATISYIIIFFLLKGCASSDVTKKEENILKPTENKLINHYEVIYVDGCKYIAFFQKYLSEAVSVVHAGDCPNHEKDKSL